ncbi:MAG: cation transporter [Hyphomonadaceae bacterium]
MNSPAWRRALWIALFANAAMFGVEIFAGVAAGSAALLADALDFFGDTATYAITLLVAGMALVWRARAALAKGLSILIFGVVVIAAAVARAASGAAPEAMTMSVIAIIAFAVNLSVAFLLYRFRTGDANMRSVWICTRNDVIGNAAVFAAALGVFGTGTAWPDILVALIMAGLGISGGATIIRAALGELKQARGEPRAA